MEVEDCKTVSNALIYTVSEVSIERFAIQTSVRHVL